MYLTVSLQLGLELLKSRGLTLKSRELSLKSREITWHLCKLPQTTDDISKSRDKIEIEDRKGE